MSTRGTRKSFIQYELPTQALKEIQGGRPPQMTTLALGEEGGTLTTLIVGEECGGGGGVTTKAIGEEGCTRY
jgi:hypothetical protein